MVKSGKTFRVEIHTPDGPVEGGEYISANIPALDGYMGILPGRSPVTAVVYTGAITLTSPDSQVHELFVSRGFLRMAGNVLTILAEVCKPSGDLDAEIAWDLLQQAYKLPRETSEQEALRDEAVQAGRIRFRLAQKARKGMMSLDELMSRGMVDKKQP